MSHEKIRAALTQLKADTDMHWTKEGEPALSFVNVLAKGKFTRDEVSSAWPGFNRTNLNPEAPAAAFATVVTPHVPEPEVKAPPPAPVAKAAQPAPPAPTPPVAPVVQEEAQEKAAAEREMLKSVIEKMEKTIDAAREKRDEAQAKLDILLSQMAESEKESFASVNQRYQASQQAEREARADKLAKLRELGVTQEMLGSVFPKGSPIDAALRNRPRR
jgi:type IV secretory pathway VirB10-like protein